MMKLHYGNLIEMAKNGEFDVIIHGSNAQGVMGSGIAKHIKDNFPEAYAADLKTIKGDRNKIGTFSEATVNINGHQLTIINAYTQYFYGVGKDHFEYDAFPQLLKSIKERYGDKKIGMPLIGCGLAGGDEQRILEMIKENFQSVNYQLVEIDPKRQLKYQEKNDYTFFFRLQSPFSNFHPSKFEYKGFIFISNEQFMMFSKAKNMSDEETAQKILDINQTTIAQDFIGGRISRLDIVENENLSKQWNQLMIKIKKLGREVKNYDENFWAQRREKIVLFGAREKFKQNLDLKEILLNTGSSMMVEAAGPNDLVWGCGFYEDEAKITPENLWKGQNLLGKILTNLKLEFQNNLQKNKEIEVKNFYHIGKKIPEDGVYIGRYNKNFNLQGSLFANPFPMKDNSEEERSRVIQEYQQWLEQQIKTNKITKNDLLQLNNKTLVCFCHPKSCHGDILKETVELLINNESEFDKKYSLINKMRP